jgi:hypothetical protein
MGCRFKTGTTLLSYPTRAPDGVLAYGSLRTGSISINRIGGYRKRISRKLWRAAGKDWAQYVYVATLPPGIDGQEPRSLPNPQGQESDAIGAEPDSTLVRNDVPTNSTRNSTYNSTEPLAKASEKQESIAGKEAFRQLFEKMKGRVPEDG